MFWRVPSKKDYDAIRGPKAKRAFRALVVHGGARGVVAFDRKEAVGWCSFGPRRKFPMTETKRAYAVADTGGVWSINCFFVRRDHRGQGIASRLLEAAVQQAGRAGAKCIEGYPSSPSPGTKWAAAWLYKGTVHQFEAAGFREIQRFSKGSPLMRRALP